MKKTLLKNQILVGVMFTLSVTTSNAQGFGGLTNWNLPAGGNRDAANNHLLGFYSMHGQPDYELNSENWSSVDMNGDGRPDLVITSKGTGSYADNMGVGFNPHWDVYFNTGTGFGSVTSWNLPAGGNRDAANNHLLGFYSTNGQPDYELNSENWSLVDMNGDNKPDLVITSKGTGSYADNMGVGFNPHWDVYFNTGTGFGSVTSWNLPAGGNRDAANNHLLGFYSTYGQPDYELNSENWALTDINGDSKPDLVVTSKGTGTYADNMGVGSNPHWDVYLNTGTGFGSVTSWNLPAGGNRDVTNNHLLGFYSTFGQPDYELNSENWSLMDFNGDKKPDLVITSRGTGSYSDNMGVGSNPHWDVYLNTGAGFGGVTTWNLPAGGNRDDANNHTLGFYAIAGQPDYELNSENWNCIDINGDNRPDLVITSKGTGSYSDNMGVGSSPHWNVHFNTGSGFGSLTSWSLPAGGNRDAANNHTLGFYDVFGQPDYELNSENWSVADMNGNGTPDLVITSKGTGSYSDNMGVGSVPHWNVHLNATVVTGIQAAEKSELKLSVFPNPFSDQLTILTSAELLHTTYSITDISGKQVVAGKIDSEISALDVSSLSKGIYVLRIEDRSFKIVKQ